MLVAMELGGADTTAAQAMPSTLPWLVLGAVLGIGLRFLVGFLLFLRRRSTDRPPPLPEQDDLPGFLEHPPGSPGAPAAAGAGWPALAPAIQPHEDTPP